MLKFDFKRRCIKIINEVVTISDYATDNLDKVLKRYMDYTCENCKSRNTWDCEDCWGKHCENFELDESTLSMEEQKMFRVFRQVMREISK